MLGKKFLDEKVAAFAEEVRQMLSNESYARVITLLAAVLSQIKPGDHYIPGETLAGLLPELFELQGNTKWEEIFLSMMTCKHGDYRYLSGLGVLVLEKLGFERSKPRRRPPKERSKPRRRPQKT